MDIFVGDVHIRMWIMWISENPNIDFVQFARFTINIHFRVCEMLIFYE